MHHVQFKPQTVHNAKCSYHCPGPLESNLYTYMCPVLDNSLILMFLSQIYRTQSKTKMNLRKQHTPAVSSMPKKLTTRLSIKVEEKLYISQNITERYIQII